MAITAAQAAESLLRDIQAAECPEDDEYHMMPGRVASENVHVRHDVLERIDPSDCGWVIPVQVEGAWAVLTYHYGGGWKVYEGAEIPEWIAEQLADEGE